jgi:hypothetical protein
MTRIINQEKFIECLLDPLAYDSDEGVGGRGGGGGFEPDLEPELGTGTGIGIGHSSARRFQWHGWVGGTANRQTDQPQSGHTVATSQMLGQLRSIFSPLGPRKCRSKFRASLTATTRTSMYDRASEWVAGRHCACPRRGEISRPAAVLHQQVSVHAALSRRAALQVGVETGMPVTGRLGSAAQLSLTTASPPARGMCS